MSDNKPQHDEAIKAMCSMIERSEKTFGKFPEGSSQHTLQKNRINALNTALELIKADLEGNCSSKSVIAEDAKKALAPIKSLISKSEKAKAKLNESSWQYKMLSENLLALHFALPLLEKQLNEPEK